MLPDFRRVSRFVLLLVLLASVKTTALFGQTATATVTGIVKDSLGLPIEQAVVSYKGATTGVNTDSRGFFLLVIPANQPITLVVHQNTYYDFRMPVNAAPGDTVSVNVRLRSRVTIAIIKDTLSTPEHINPKPFFRLPSAAGPDISGMLRYLGAQSSNELSTQYSVRGGNFDENLVYVNGIEVYRPFLTRAGQQEGLSFVNVDMAEDVYFSAGGFEAKYGDKMSSVLDVRYREPGKFAGTVSLSLLGLTAEVEGVSENKHSSWMIGIRNKSNRYLLNSLDTRGDYRANFVDGQVFFRHYFTEEWTIDYLGNYAMNRYNLVPSTRETDFGTLNNALRFTVYFDGQEINHFTTMFHAVALQRKGPRWNTRFIVSSYNSYETETFDVQGQYYIDQLEADFGKPTFGQVAFNRGVGTFLNHARNYLDAWVNTGEVQLLYVDSNIVYSFGLRYQNERINDEVSEWNMVDSAGYSIPYLPYESLDLQDVVKGHSQLYSNRVMGYAQLKYFATFKDSSEFTLTLGARSQYWDMNNQVIVSPRVQATWKPHWKTNIQFRAAAGIYNQPPFYKELRDFAGNINRDIRSQTSVHAIVGSTLYFRAWNRTFCFISEAYYKYLDNLIPYEVNDVRIRYFGSNMAYGRTYGIDLRLNGQIVKGVESWVNISFLRTEENLYHDDYYLYLNSDGDTIVPGFTLNNVPTDSIHQEPGFIPRPTDQLMTFALYFQDYLPEKAFKNADAFKMNLGLILGTGLPFGPPNHKRYQQIFRMPPYRRVDIGFSYEAIREEKPLKETNPLHFMKSLWIGAEVYNLLQVQNTISYYWIKDVTGRTYAVPNYLTNRQVSVRVIMKF